MNTPLRRSDMAGVLKGSHSFTCTPHVHPLNGMNHTCLCLPSRSWYSFTDPGGMEDTGLVTLGSVAEAMLCEGNCAASSECLPIDLLATFYMGSCWMALSLKLDKEVPQ